MPSQAVYELDHEPERLAVRILHLRSYARVKSQLDSAENAGQVPKPSPVFDEVKANTERYIRERTTLLCPST